jgi:hypothetical protein
MNEGGYSRLERDFLGNERMVHYDASGNMLGASDVIREPDGTIRITNEPVSATEPNELPKVEAIVPPSKPTAVAPTIGVRDRQNAGLTMNQVVMYSIAAFIATSLLTLAVLSFKRSNGPDASVNMRANAPQPRMSPPINGTEPDRRQEPETFPSDPKPRNDDPPLEPRPRDEAAPDSNMDDTKPRIKNSEPNPQDETAPNQEKSPKKKPTEDPIDLRGDDSGKKDPPKKGDPSGDPLKGNDIH